MRRPALELGDLVAEQGLVALDEQGIQVTAQGWFFVRGVAMVGSKRFPLYPDIPTLEELGLGGFDDGGFFLLIAPAGMPSSVAGALNRALVASLTAPDIREKLLFAGHETTQIAMSWLLYHLARHPEALARVRAVSGTRTATGASVFFAGGNVGFALGPILATVLTQRFGAPGALVLLVPTLLALALADLLGELLAQRQVRCDAELARVLGGDPQRVRVQIAGVGATQRRGDALLEHGDDLVARGLVLGHGDQLAKGRVRRPHRGPRRRNPHLRHARRHGAGLRAALYLQARHRPHGYPHARLPG